MSTGGGGGRFDFDDGGTYCGGWEDGKAHGHGVCTGPQSQGQYAGAWKNGFEESGTYTWPSGNTYSGRWNNGKRDGLGVETRGHWMYRGEWTQGFKGRYGVRQSTISKARYEGTWVAGLQEGCGVETYADEGTYQGQWLRGLRHGYGIRQSVPYSNASHCRDHHTSMPHLAGGATTLSAEQDRGRSTDRSRGGFVLTNSTRSASSSRAGDDTKTLPEPRSRSSSFRRTLANTFHIKQKQRSTSDLPSAVKKNTLEPVTGNGTVPIENGANIIETYMGEWKSDKRTGFGISQRSDGLSYTGEWYNDKKHGFGVTTSKNGFKEEGKYKDNELMSSGKKTFSLRKSKLKHQIEAALTSAQRAAEAAAQKADIAMARKANAKLKASHADQAAETAAADAEAAKINAAKYEHQPASKPTGSFDSSTTDKTVSTNSTNRVTDAKPYVEERLRRGSSSRTHSANADDSGVVDASSRKLALDIRPVGQSSMEYDDHTRDRTDSPFKRLDSSFKSSSPAHLSDDLKPLNPTSYSVRENEDKQISPRMRDDYSREFSRPATKSSYSPEPATSNSRNPTSFREPVLSSYSREPLTSSYSREPLTSSYSREPAISSSYSREPAISSSYSREPATSSPYPRERAISPSSYQREPMTSSYPRERLTSSPSYSRERLPSSYSREPAASSSYVRDPVSSSSYPRERAISPASYSRERVTSYSGDSGMSSYPHEQIASSSSSSYSREPYETQIKQFDLTHQTLPYNSDTRNDHRLPETAHNSSMDNRRYPNTGITNPGRTSSPINSSSSHMWNAVPSAFDGSSKANDADVRPRHSVSDIDVDEFKSRVEQFSRNNPSSRLGSYGSPLASSSPHPSKAVIGGGGTTIGTTFVRRQTLPCIVRYPPVTSLPNKSPSASPTRDVARAKTPPIPNNPTTTDMYVIDNGVRKRLVSEPVPVTSTADATADNDDISPLQPVVTLQSRYRLESTPGLATPSIRCSMPDMSTYRRLVQQKEAIAPREQVSVLSQQKRDELRQQREEEDRRRRQQIIIKFTDIKEWCIDQQLFLFFLALNLCLAALFFHFLSPDKKTSK